MPDEHKVTVAECAAVHAGLHGKLASLEEKIDTHFKSIEVNMISSFAQVTVRQDRANDAVAKLKESDIRRDEREKMQERGIGNFPWTGVSPPSPTRANLANARQAGMLTAGYTVVNNLSGVTAINKAATAAGPEWAHLAFVSVDVEVATTAATVREAVDGLRAQGKNVCIYTGGWFWNSFNLVGHDFSDVPCWLARYDGNPAMDTAPLIKLGPVIGKQYRNSHDLGGGTGDANTFDDSFIHKEKDDMPFLIHNAAGTYWEMCPGGFKKAIVFPALQAYAEAAGQGFSRGAGG